MDTGQERTGQRDIRKDNFVSETESCRIPRGYTLTGIAPVCMASVLHLTSCKLQQDLDKKIWSVRCSINPARSDKRFDGGVGEGEGGGGCEGGVGLDL